MGAGFSFIGKQYRLEIGGDEFFIDLLFYHVKLHCYVVLELKSVKFKPEFAGQLNFYISPDNMNIKEASTFWDNHSVADYPSHAVQLEYSPEERMTFVAIANNLLGQLERQAKNQGASIEMLVNLWIQEKLTTYA